MATRILLLLAGLLMIESQSWARTPLASDPTTPNEELAELLRTQGIHHWIAPGEQRGNADILLSAKEEALRLDYDCTVERFAEVYICTGDELPLELEGFAVTLYCEEAPIPGVILYFDLDHRYLRAFEMDD